MGRSCGEAYQRFSKQWTKRNVTPERNFFSQLSLFRTAVRSRIMLGTYVLKTKGYDNKSMAAFQATKIVLLQSYSKLQFSKYLKRWKALLSVFRSYTNWLISDNFDLKRLLFPEQVTMAVWGGGDLVPPWIPVTPFTLFLKAKVGITGPSWRTKNLSYTHTHCM